jgi:hypothetical protein
MCEFEDMDLSSPAGRQPAGDDDEVVEVLRFHGKRVLATAHLAEAICLDEILAIWREFRLWNDTVRPLLPGEEQQFATGANGRQVFVIEDAHAYTLMYPEDY